MAETSTADVAEKARSYQEGLQGFMQSQAEPRNFVESPMAGLIPFAGPWLQAAGQTQIQKRMNDARIKSAYFDAAVQTGDLTPDHPATQGIPLPIIQAGLVEAAKVRATPSYQGRQLLKEATPSWQGDLQGPYLDEGPDSTFSPQRQQDTTQRHLANFKAFAQQNPEIFGTLGSPETGRLALENINTQIGLGMAQQKGLPVPGWFQGSQGQGQGTGGGGASPAASPAGEITQTPMEQAPITGPGATALQQQTGLAQRAQQAGANPRTVLALKGTEASQSWQVSPKGAASEFQLMPETARPYLPKEMQPWSTNQIRTTLKKDPKLAESVAIAHIKDLQTLWPDNPQAVAAAYFSGVGNVRKDGTVIDWSRHDGTATKPGTTVRQYVDRFTQRFTGQTLASGQPGAAALPDQTPQAQGQVAGQPASSATQQVPYRPFDPSAPRPRQKSTMTFGAKTGYGFSDEETSLPDAAAAHMAAEVTRNPQNYKQAYLDLAQKSALPPPEQLKLIQAGAARAIYQHHEQSLISQGYQGTSKALQIEAFKRTAEDMGIAITPEIATAIQNEPLNSDVITALRERATLQEQAGPPGQALRQQQRESAVQQSADIQRKTGEVRADLPIEQLPDYGELKTRFPGINPKSSISQMGKDLDIAYDEQFMKRSTSTENAYAAIQHLETLFLKTGPSTSPSIQGFNAVLRKVTPEAWKVNAVTYKEMREALPGMLAAVAGESGGRYSDKNVENWMKMLPRDETDKNNARERFNFVKEQILRPHFTELDYRTHRTMPLQKEYEESRPERQPGPGSASPPSRKPGAPLIPVP